MYYIDLLRLFLTYIYWIFGCNCVIRCRVNQIVAEREVVKVDQIKGTVDSCI